MNDKEVQRSVDQVLRAMDALTERFREMTKAWSDAMEAMKVKRIYMLGLDEGCASESGDVINQAIAEYGSGICEQCNYHMSDGRCLCMGCYAQKGGMNT